MSTAAPPFPADRIAPRRGVLTALVAGVLLAHLSLLSGGLSGLSLDLFKSPGGDPAAPPGAPLPPTLATEAETALAEGLPPPVSSSRVRWILPKPPEPEPAPPPPPPPPPKVVEPPPPPPPPVEALIEPPAEPVAEPPPVEVAAVAPEAPPAEPPAPAPAESAPAAPVSDLPPATEVAAGTVAGKGIGLADAGLPPALPPPSADLRYTATSLSKGKTYNGTAQLEWAHDGQQYQARLTVRVLVFTVLSQGSTGGVGPKGLLPDRFTDQRRSSERAAHFDRTGQRLRFSSNAPDAQLLPGAQDRLSVNFQLAALFNARPDAYAQGQTLRLPVSSVDAAEVWLFQVGTVANEPLPAGEVQTVRLTRAPRKEYDRKVEIWLLPAYAHLPGRIRITEPNGDYLDMQLQELPPLPTANMPNTP
jgi:outer membrane biosynthesis protein TonB